MTRRDASVVELRRALDPGRPLPRGRARGRRHRRPPVAGRGPRGAGPVPPRPRGRVHGGGAPAAARPRRAPRRGRARARRRGAASCRSRPSRSSTTPTAPATCRPRLEREAGAPLAERSAQCDGGRRRARRCGRGRARAPVEQARGVAPGARVRRTGAPPTTSCELAERPAAPRATRPRRACGRAPRRCSRSRPSRRASRGCGSDSALDLARLLDARPSSSACAATSTTRGSRPAPATPGRPCSRACHHHAYELAPTVGRARGRGSSVVGRAALRRVEPRVLPPSQRALRTTAVRSSREAPAPPVHRLDGRDEAGQDVRPRCAAARPRSASQTRSSPNSSSSGETPRSRRP